MQPKLIVHGGAWNIPENLHEAHLSGCREVIRQIYPELQKGIKAVVAVEAAVSILEEDPTFDAGRGAFLNSEGEVELDAIICDGKTLNFGAVAAIKNVLHPIRAARLLMNHPEHCFMVGEGAQKFLRQMNFPEVAIEELLTERELEFYRRIKSDPHFKTRKPFEPGPDSTVGAVAIDIHGDLAAATSTGGTPRKLPGRVGDSPVVGAGAYADNRKGAVSASGYGESILKVLLSKLTCDEFEKNPAMKAAQNAIQLLQDRVKGLGGVIGINSSGDYGFFHNTRYMAIAYYHPSKKIVALIHCSR
jgi:beta-aspartyl-peptidase (threonine type)